jgi:hypothetical protein
MKIDFIGDIHGNAFELECLLSKLGYQLTNGFYQHPDNRKVIFVGDFIDRGPKIKETLKIVKAMCDHGTAEAVMGNHEFNAILFHTKNKKQGGFYRAHDFKEINSHFETLKQFKDNPEEWLEYLNWFKTLPLFIETDQYRVVHAYWNQDYVEYLKKNPIIWDETFFDKVIDKSSIEYQLSEDLLKGIEYKLPNGYFFHDKDGIKRDKSRIKWWHKTNGVPLFGDYLINCPEELQHEIISDFKIEIPSNKPIFFGHYWLKDDHPSVSNPNAICLDYSVAKKGHLVAYSFDTKTITTQKSRSE